MTMETKRASELKDRPAKADDGVRMPRLTMLEIGLDGTNSYVARDDTSQGCVIRQNLMVELLMGETVGPPWWVTRFHEEVWIEHWTFRGMTVGPGAFLIDFHCPERGPNHPDGRVYSALVVLDDGDPTDPVIEAVLQSRTCAEIDLSERPPAPWAALVIRGNAGLALPWMSGLGTSWRLTLAEYLAYGWRELHTGMEPVIRELEWCHVLERVAPWRADTSGER